MPQPRDSVIMSAPIFHIARMICEMSNDADICVVGAGPVGLALAAALRLRGGRFETVVLDRGENREDDGKSVAFGPRAQNFLQELNAWPNNNKPIRRAEVSFAPLSDSACKFPPLRPLILEGGEGSALASIAPHEEARAALLSQVRDCVRTATVLEVRDAGDFAEIELRDAKPIRAKLAVLACAFSRLPRGFAARDFDYGQCAMALSGRIENNEGGWDGETAYEYFSPDGILTLVPRGTGENKLGGVGGVGRVGGVGVVICAGSGVGAEWSGLSDAGMSSRLSAMFAGRGFRIRIDGARRTYAPQLRRVSPLGRGRIICIGQGASIVHPIGAQGLNLALRDANILADTLASCGGLEGDGAGSFSSEFSRQRTRDHRGIATATHFLALLARRRGFPLRLAGAAFSTLAASDLAAPLRARLSKTAMKNY